VDDQGGRGTLVIGVGNRYRRDDGAGLAAAARLAEAAGARVVLCDGIGDGTALLDIWQNSETVILIDAVRSGAPAGTIHRRDAGGADGSGGIGAMPDAGAGAAFRGPQSTHGLGVAEAIALGRLLHRLPRRLVILGVEGARFDAGEELSPAVGRAVDAVVRFGLEALADSQARRRRL
jgi:hydrogenase maturation protease